MYVTGIPFLRRTLYTRSNYNLKHPHVTCTARHVRYMVTLITFLYTMSDTWSITRTGKMRGGFVVYVHDVA